MSALSYRTETVIRRSPEEVFEYCSDLRSELHRNPKVKYVEKLTDGPVGVGTRYRAGWDVAAPVGFARAGPARAAGPSRLVVALFSKRP